MNKTDLARTTKLALYALATLFLMMGPDPADAQPASWKAEWEKTLAAARQERQVNIYITTWGPVLASGLFEKSYPGIKLVIIEGPSPQISQRVLAERRAEKYLADVSSGGLNPNLLVFYDRKMLDPVKRALALPEVADESKWWQGKHHYVDPEHQYVLKFTNTPQYGAIGYNTKLVNERELNSFWDLLNPKWKGRIAIRDIRDPGPGGDASRLLYYNPAIGPEFIRRLIREMDITLFRDLRQGVDWLASGKFAICLFCQTGMLRQAKHQGLPVSEFSKPLKEGVGLVAQAGTLALMDKAPHPNAAKVFINWWLSREGQLNLIRETTKATGGDIPDSLRIDIPKDDVPRDNRRIEGYKYFDLDSRQDWLDRRPILKVFEEALGQTGRK